MFYTILCITVFSLIITTMMKTPLIALPGFLLFLIALALSVGVNVLVMVISLRLKVRQAQKGVRHG